MIKMDYKTQTRSENAATNTKEMLVGYRMKTAA
jgi:hypothetical protein